ncbi:MAG: hypothetical protein Q7J76_03740 [Candidatus Brocadiaceae bacterium]|nr:hypothetical protein [Candidatus Brocadiaceae bacterium]
MKKISDISKLDRPREKLQQKGALRHYQTQNSLPSHWEAAQKVTML